MFFLLFACSGDPTSVDPGDTGTPDDTPDDTGVPDDSGTPSDTADTADTGSDAFSWEDTCSETLSDPMALTGPEDVFDAFGHTIVFAALHILIIDDFIYEGEETGCPLLTSIDEYTTELSGDCESFIGSTYSGTLQVTNTPSSWMIEATDFSATTNVLSQPLSYSADGWLQESWSDTGGEMAATLMYQLDGEDYAEHNVSMYQNVRGGYAQLDEDSYTDWLEGFISVGWSADGIAGDACVAWTYERGATCEDEGDGYLAVLGAQEAWLVTSAKDCDGCYDVTIDGVAQEDYCR